MNIFTDGARSRRRLSVAKKAVQQLKALGIDKKVGIRDGFLYKVTKEGKGWIKAPFGIYVVLSDEKGIRQFTCDSVGSPALPYFDATAKDRYGLMPDPMPPIIIVPGQTYPYPTDGYGAIAGDAGTQMLEFDPYVPINPEPYKTIPYQWGAPTPVVMPVGAEAVSIRLSYQRTSQHFVNTTQVTHCYNNGVDDAVNEVKSLAITQTYAASPGINAGRDNTFRVPLHASAGRWGEVWWKPGYLWADARLFTIMYPDLRDGTYYVFNQLVGGVIPEGPLYRVSSVMVARDTTNDNGMTLVNETVDRRAQIRATVVLWQGIAFVDYENGHSTRSLADMEPALTASTATADGDLWWVYQYYSVYSIWSYPKLRGLYDFTGWFPEAVNIKAGDYWVVRAGGTVSIPNDPEPPSEFVIYSLSVLVAKVDNAAKDAPTQWQIGKSTLQYVTDGGAAAQTYVNEKVLLSFAGRSFRSNGDSVAFNDSESFPDSEGVMYTWHRITDPSATQTAWGQAYTGAKNGGFKFTYAAGGFSRVVISMPETISLDIERHPSILLMTKTTYVCLTKSWDNIIHNIHVGSPFASWLPVDMPAAAVMYSVRVTTPGNTVDECGFIGVGKVTGEDYEYYIFFKPLGNPWVRLSPIPLVGLEHVEDIVSAWDVCVFGDDAVVGSMLSCKQHPISRPEISGKHR